MKKKTKVLTVKRSLIDPFLLEILEAGFNNKVFKKLNAVLPAFSKTFRYEYEKRNKRGDTETVSGSYEVPVNHYRRIRRAFNRDGANGVLRYLIQFKRKPADNV